MNMPPGLIFGRAAVGRIRTSGAQWGVQPGGGPGGMYNADLMGRDDEATG